MYIFFRNFARAFFVELRPEIRQIKSSNFRYEKRLPYKILQLENPNSYFNVPYVKIKPKYPTTLQIFFQIFHPTIDLKIAHATYIATNKCTNIRRKNTSPRPYRTNVWIFSLRPAVNSAVIARRHVCAHPALLCTVNITHVILIFEFRQN